MEKYQFTPLPNTGALSEDDSKKYFSTVGLAIFSFLFVSFSTSFIASLLMAKFAPSWSSNAAIKSGISLITQYGFGLPAALYFLRKLPSDTNPTEKLGLKGFLGTLCVAFTFMTVGSTVSDLIIGGLALIFNKELQNPVENSVVGDSVLVNLIFLVILIPIIEELVFRKLICDKLLPLGEGYAVFISAAIFGLIHRNLFQFFYAFLTGMLFSYIYVKTGRIRYTVSIHMLINLIGTVFVPWLLKTLSPVLTEELYERLTEVMSSSDPAAMEAMAAELTPYMVPILLLGAYELIFTVMSMIGVFVLFSHLKKIKLQSGLLPPDKEHRIANIFCNGGVALAITAFTVLFVVSLI